MKTTAAAVEQPEMTRLHLTVPTVHGHCNAVESGPDKKRARGRYGMQSIAPGVSCLAVGVERELETRAERCTWYSDMLLVCVARLAETVGRGVTSSWWCRGSRLPRKLR